jgi:hypothetical protein
VLLVVDYVISLLIIENRIEYFFYDKFITGKDLLIVQSEYLFNKLNEKQIISTALSDKHVKILGKNHSAYDNIDAKLLDLVQNVINNPLIQLCLSFNWLLPLRP